MADAVSTNLENWIAQYKARIAKIGQSPDRSKLKSNQLFYEMMRDANIRLLHHYQEGKPILMGDSRPPVHILDVMGFASLSLDLNTQQRVPHVPRFLDIADSQGFSSQVCTSTRAGAGLVLSREVPPPSLLYGDSFCCIPMYLRNHYLAQVYRCPTVYIDAGYYVEEQKDDFEETVNYVAEQIRQMVPILERISGLPLDEEKVRQAQEAHWRALHLAMEAEEMAKAVPAPLSGRDSLRFAPRSSVRPAKLIEYYQALRDELWERVDSGFAAVPGERLRLLWLQTPPLFTDTFQFLEERRVAVICEMGGLDHKRFISGLREEKFEKDTIFQREARWFLDGHWYGPNERRIQGVLRFCRDYRIDGVVHFNQRSCPYYAHTSRAIKDRVEKELNLPMLILDGDFMNVRDFDESTYYAHLEAFLELCLAQTHSR